MKPFFAKLKRKQGAVSPSKCSTLPHRWQRIARSLREEGGLRSANPPYALRLSRPKFAKTTLESSLRKSLPGGLPTHTQSLSDLRPGDTSLAEDVYMLLEGVCHRANRGSCRTQGAQEFSIGERIPARKDRGCLAVQDGVAHRYAGVTDIDSWPANELIHRL